LLWQIGQRLTMRACLQAEEADARSRGGVSVGSWDSRRGEGRVPLLLPQDPEAGAAGPRQVRALRAPAHLGLIASQPLGQA
jgi:hypothetical protein